jgi:hypothetical protein
LTRSGPTDDHDREAAKRDFANEWLALEDSSGSGQTPRYLAWGEIPQNDSMSYPGGYIRVLVMSKVPGQNVGQILLLDLIAVGTGGRTRKKDYLIERKVVVLSIF